MIHWKMFADEIQTKANLTKKKDTLVSMNAIAQAFAIYHLTLICYLVAPFTNMV